MNKQAGDGTTTVTVLTYSILKEANRLIAAGHNPMELRKGIEQAGAEIVKELNKLAEPIEGKSERVAEVATISAGDAEIGKLIANVIEKLLLFFRAALARLMLMCCSIFFGLMPAHAENSRCKCSGLTCTAAATCAKSGCSAAWS